MARFTRGTTPDIEIIIEAFDATGNEAYVTISQGPSKMVTISGERLTVTVDDTGETPSSKIKLKLTQEETFSILADSKSRWLCSSFKWR